MPPGHGRRRCFEASSGPQAPFCPPTRKQWWRPTSSNMSLKISWEYTQASQVRGRISSPFRCHVRLYSCPRNKASAGTRYKIQYWILQNSEPDKWKFKSQLCHVTWASYLTFLNFNLIVSSVIQVRGMSVTFPVNSTFLLSCPFP